MAVNKYTLLGKRAIKLRKQGKSYKEIGKELGVSKGTLSLWLKGVPLCSKLKKRLYTARILNLARGPYSQKERREKEIKKIIEDAKSEIWNLNKQAFKLFGAALYWAEGSKTKNFEVTNSDPILILFMVRWFEEVFSVSAKNLKIHMNIYSQQDENQLKGFWSELLGIPLENFGKSFLKPSGKGFKKNTLYYGTVKVRVPKGTDMKHRVFGWIQGALQDIIPLVESKQKKWIAIKKDREPVNLT